MQILVGKKLKLTDIEIQHSDYEFFFEPVIQQEIDRLRSEKLEEAKEQQQHIRDGLSYYLDSYAFENDKLTLTLGTTRFRNISMSKFLPETIQESIIKTDNPKGMYIAGFIKTCDNYYLIPKRNSTNVTSSTTGKFTMFGGVLQPDDAIVKNSQALRDHMLVELEQEAGLLQNDIYSGEFIGLVASKAGNRGIMFHIDLNISADQVMERFEKSNDGEMEETIRIPETELLDFLYEQGYDSEGNCIDNMGLYRELLMKVWF